MDVRSCDHSAIFRAFTCCSGDTPTFLVDLRPAKEFSKRHIALSYCIRLTSNGQALVDYSKNEYDKKWSMGCWWGKNVIMFGPAGLRKDHPVVVFLAKEGRAGSLRVYSTGFEALASALPFLVTASVKIGSSRRYPSFIEPLLYLGDWAAAENRDRLEELGVQGVVTVHNNPDNLRVSPGVTHLPIQLADVGSADIGAWFDPVAEFIERVQAQGGAVLVHCGAGVSRSATLVIATLMRSRRWAAAHALAHVAAARSVVSPNDGFWRALCMLEARLGIPDRSDPDRFAGALGADAAGVGAAAAAPAAAPTVAFVPAAPPAPRSDGVDRAGRRRDDSRDRGTRGRSRSRSPRGRQQGRRQSRSRSPHGRHRGHAGSGRSERPGRSPSTKAKADPSASPGLVLAVERGEEALGQLVIASTGPTQAPCVFGRLPSCEVPLEHQSISRAHAHITTDSAGRAFLTDLGSAHGTNVDGVWIRPKTARELQVGTTFRLGASTRAFRVVKLPDASR